MTLHSNLSRLAFVKRATGMRNLGVDCWVSCFLRVSTLCVCLMLTMSSSLAQGREMGIVEVRGQLSSSSASKGEVVRFWITVHNGSAATVLDVRLEHLDIPGFRLERRCWVQNASPDCGTPPTLPDPADLANLDRIATKLEPGESRTIWGDLISDQINHAQNLFAVIGWSSGKEGRSWSSASLGSAASITEGQRLWSDVRDVVKDIGMPILLLLLSIVVGLQQRNREEKQKQLDAQRAQISQTWNQMLPESHRVAKKYYMPMIASLQETIRRSEAYISQRATDLKGADANKRRAFYHLTMFAWHAREVSWKIGGYFFRNRVGEKLAYYAFLKYYKLYGDDESTLRDRTKLLDLLVANSTLSSFTDLEASSPDIWKNAWNSFQSWIDDRGTGTLPYLKAFIEVVEFETNRPYELWYGQNFLTCIDKETRSTLENLHSEDLSQEQIKDYIKSISTAC
jgi:hypothetical protein